MSIEDINKRLGIDLLELYSIMSSSDQDAKNHIRIKDFPKDFVDQVMGLLGQIKPMKIGINERNVDPSLYSATRTFEGITDEGLKKLLGFIYLCPPSKYLDSSKNVKYAALTPKALYAQRMYNDITYMQWDSEDPMLKFFLGRQLEWLPIVRNAWVKPIELRDPASLRAAFIGEAPLRTYQSKLGNMPVPVYKDIHRARLEKTARDPEVNSNAEKVYWRMLLQLWIANIATRVVDNATDTSPMILDPWDWDLVPEALDAGIDISLVNTSTTRRKDTELLPF